MKAPNIMQVFGAASNYQRPDSDPPCA